MHNHVVAWRGQRVTIVWFGVFAGAGIAIGVLLVLAGAFWQGLSLSGVAGTLVVALLTAVLGSRLLSLAVDWRKLLAEPKRTLLSTGFAFQGGLAATALGLVWSTRAFGLQPLVVADLYAMSLPLAHAIGRLGCFSYGCCHGRPTAHRLGVVVTNPESKTVWGSGLGGVRLHPAALYEAMLGVVMFALIGAVAASGPVAGTLTALYLTLEPVKRLFIETLRGEGGKRYLGLSVYQINCLFLLIAALGVWLSRDPGVLLVATPVSAAALLAALGPWLPLAGVLLALGLAAYGVHGPTLGRFAVPERLQQDLRDADLAAIRFSPGTQVTPITLPGDPDAGALCIHRGEGAAVVLVHGAGSDRLHGLWALTEALVDAGLKVYTAHLPGHGRGGSDVFSLPAARRRLDALIEAAGPGAVVLGQSLGGALALDRLARGGTHPTLTVSAPHTFTLSGSAVGELGALLRRHTWATLRHVSPTDVLPAAGLWRRGRFPVRTDGEGSYIDALGAQLDELGLIARPTPPVEVPVRLIHGGRDGVVPVEQAHALAAWMDRPEALRVIPDACHLDALLHPDSIAEVVAWCRLHAEAVALRRFG